MISKSQLLEFEAEVAKRFEAGEIRGPIHLSGGNEIDLWQVFQHVNSDDYVFSTWRNHYHALLHGIPERQLMEQIVAGHSMNIMFPERRFFTSSIVGGILPIAVGVAAGLKMANPYTHPTDNLVSSDGCNWVKPRHVWAFIGDMTACTGIFHECQQYAQAQNLPITFVVESNGFSTDTPTVEAWGQDTNPRCGGNVIRYAYERTYPHCGIGKYVNF